MLAGYDARVDRAFRGWLKTALPSRLRAVAVTLPHDIGVSRSRRWNSWRGVFRSPLMRSLPGLVAEAFPALSDAHLDGLGLAHVLLAFVAFVDDRLNDGQAAFSRDAYLVRRCMEAEAAAQLDVAIGRQPRFWQIARDAFRRYGAAHARESRRWSGDPLRDSPTRYADEASGKIAIAQLPAVAVALTGGASPREITQLTRAFDHCLVALQYTDDVADWRDDFRSGRWTDFVRRHLRPRERRRRNRVTAKELGQRIAAGTATAECLGCAARHYDAALDLTTGFTLPTLRAWIATRRDLALADAAAPRRVLVAALRRAWLS